MKKVAIITLNYNRKKDTLEFLESLKKLSTENCELKTVVVDNASADFSVSAIHEKFPDVDVLQTGSNLGFSGGYNKGIKYAQIWGADYFLIINNDTLIAGPDLLQQLIKTASIDEKIGLVSPKIYFAPGFEFHKDRYKKDDLGKVIWYGGGSFDWDNIGSVHRGIDQVDDGQFDHIEQTDLISGACVLVKKEVFEKTYLDEDYFLYFEDSDFQKKVTDLGFKKFYNGKVSIFHKVSQSTGIGSQITDYYHTRNRLFFGMKYGKARTKFALLREALKFLLIGRKPQKQGVWDFLLGKRGGASTLHLFESEPEGSIPQSRRLPGGNFEYPLKLSIGVVNYNTADLIKNLLESIFKKGSGFNPQIMEVIVLDNGNIDPCKDVIKDYLHKVKYLKNEENEGFPKGYNKTIRFSLGEHYLMLNSDIEVLGDGLSKVVKTMDEHKGEAVLGAKLIFPNGVVQDSVFHLPTITGALKEYFLRQKGAYFMYAPDVEKEVLVEGAAMAAYMIPQKILKKVGPLDENIFILFEDVEYAQRLGKFGVPIYYDPQIKFLHHHGASTKKQGISKSYDQLKKSSMYYHGKVYYWLLYYTLLFCQKFSGTRTPGEIR